MGHVRKVTPDVFVTWRKVLSAPHSRRKGRGVTAPYMLNLGTLQGRVVSFTGWPH